MNRQDSIKLQTHAIIDNNNGQAMFNFKESAHILGCHPHTVPRLLNDHGVLISRFGRKKMVSAVELAKVMYSGMTSPFDEYFPAKVGASKYANNK